MITFWLVCGIFILIALAFVLPPFWQSESESEKKENDVSEANLSIYKDQLTELEGDLQNGLVSQEQFEHDRNEIKRRLLEDVSSENAGKNSTKPPAEARGAAYAIAIALPILAIGLYFKIGNPSLRPNQLETTAPSTVNGTAEGGMSQAQIEANVAALAKRLDANPSDADGWVMLARSYGVLEKYDESSKAYERAVKLKPRDADLLADYAFALAMANGRRFEGKPRELIDRALELDPDNPRVLGLAGGAAFERKDYSAAIVYWNKLLARMPPNSELGQAISEKLKAAKDLANASSKER